MCLRHNAIMVSEKDPNRTHDPVDSDRLKAELAGSATNAAGRNRQSRASVRPFSSIRAKLGIFAVFEVALISAALYMFFPSHLEDHAVDAITKRASAVADMAAYVISGRHNPQSVSDVDVLLRASAQVEDLVYIFLTAPDGSIISEVNRDPGRYLANSEIRKPGGLSPQHDIFRVHRAVEVTDGSRRTLHLAISLEPLVRTARRSRATVAGVCLLILVIGVIGVILMSRIITAPLKEIVATAEKISNGELEHRVKVTSDDEIGRLGASFNNMVDGLKSAYKHLESANATLAYHSEDLQAEIAQKKRAEEALRASEAKFRAVVEHATDVVAVLNESGRIRYVSPATIHMMGVSPESLVGNEVVDFVHPDDRPILQRALNQSKSLTGIIEADVRWRHANGKWRYLAFRGRNLADLPGIEGLLFNVTDVTEAKHFQTELVLAKEKAEEMVALKDSFLTNMSHEIRTPLTGILGFAQILKTEVDDDKFELVEHIQRSGQRLLNTLNAVLDLAELEALSARPELGRVPVGHEIREAAHIVGPVAQLKNLYVRLNLPEEEVYATANSNCLLRTLTNLASNAVKFTEVGGVTISLRKEDDHVTIAIEDSGVGISESFMPSLFGEFTQESTGNSRSHEGSGLGLAITRRLVDLMNGTISVDSKKGHGTTFFVTLPLADDQVGSSDSAVSQSVSDLRTRLKPVPMQRDRLAS